MNPDSESALPTEIQLLEERDRLGYARLPQMDDEWSVWERVEAWPEE